MTPLAHPLIPAFAPHALALNTQLEACMAEHVYPSEARFKRGFQGLGTWQVQPVVSELKPKAQATGLCKLFLPGALRGAGVSKLDDAPLCEVMGRSHLAPEVFNDSTRQRPTRSCP